MRLAAGQRWDEDTHQPQVAVGHEGAAVVLVEGVHRPRLKMVPLTTGEIDQLGFTRNNMAGFGALAVPLRGSAEEIADGLREFRDGGFTQIEILLWPRTLTALEAMVPVLQLLDADYPREPAASFEFSVRSICVTCCPFDNRSSGSMAPSSQ